AEQDVLGSDELVAEGESLAQRELEHLLRARGERDLALGRPLLPALADDARDLLPHSLGAHAERLEHARCQALVLAQQAEEEVLGADVAVAERPRLVLREDDDLAGPLGEPLEHPPPSVARVTPL